MSDREYRLSNSQKEYIFDLVAKRQEELSNKAKLYNSLRNSEKGISAKQKNNEQKVLNEQDLIHSIIHELCADEFNV